MQKVGLVCMACLVMSLVGCVVTFGDGVKGSGEKASETRDVESFNRIKLTGSSEVIVTIGEPQSVTVEADDNLLDIITTEVRGGSLVISARESYSSRVGVTVTITAPELRGVSITGSGDVSVEDLEVESFETSVTGSGDITARGQADSLEAKVTGSGDIDCFGLKVRRAEASIYGSGDIRLHVSESLSGAVYGSGDIEYRGNPKDVERTVAGSGDISAR
jgi:hypothetical protein